MKNIKATVAQIRTIAGDIDGNLRRIQKGINIAISDNSDIVIFPETAISGYCCGALFDTVSFIEHQYDVLISQIVSMVPDDLVCIVGFVRMEGMNKNGFPKIWNSVAIIQGGKIIGTYDKYLLANSDHHEDRKYFRKGENIKVFDVTLNDQNVTIGTPICEDIWNVDHETDVVSEMVSLGAEAIFCVNQSYYYNDKEHIRTRLVENHAKKNGVPVVYVNSVGVGDIVKNILVFDGNSVAVNSNGEISFVGTGFDEQYSTFELLNTSSDAFPERDKYETIFDALVFAVKEMFDLSGIHKAQVHVSGGIDSSVVACIVKEAMSGDNTIFISNPSQNNSENLKDKASILANNLGVELHWNSIGSIYDTFIDQHETDFGKNTLSDVAQSSIQTTLRTVQMIASSHMFGSGNVCAANQTENVLGWVTFHDVSTAGVLSPIGNLTKKEVFELAEYINCRYGMEVIPEELYDIASADFIKPAAELVDASDDPIDYKIMSGVCALIVRRSKSPKEIIRMFEEKALDVDLFYDDVYLTDKNYFQEQVWNAFARSKRFVYKTAQAAPGVVIMEARDRGFSARETLINKWTGDLR